MTRDAYPALGDVLQDLPELLAFFQCPRSLWRPERIIFSIFNRFNLEWRQHTLREFTQAA